MESRGTSQILIWLARCATVRDQMADCTLPLGVARLRRLGCEGPRLREARRIDYEKRMNGSSLYVRFVDCSALKTEAVSTTRFEVVASLLVV